MFSVTVYEISRLDASLASLYEILCGAQLDGFGSITKRFRSSPRGF
jgi:hypothetical protein